MVEPDDSESEPDGTGVFEPSGPPGEPWLLPTFSVEGLGDIRSVVALTVSGPRAFLMAVTAFSCPAVCVVGVLTGPAAAEGPEEAGLSVERDLSSGW